MPGAAVTSFPSICNVISLIFLSPFSLSFFLPWGVEAEQARRRFFVTERKRGGTPQNRSHILVHFSWSITWIWFFRR